jgi:hypothetical protein
MEQILFRLVGIFQNKPCRDRRSPTRTSVKIPALRSKNQTTTLRNTTEDYSLVKKIQKGVKKLPFFKIEPYFPIRILHQERICVSLRKRICWIWDMTERAKKTHFQIKQRKGQAFCPDFSLSIAFFLHLISTSISCKLKRT